LVGPAGAVTVNNNPTATSVLTGIAGAHNIVMSACQVCPFSWQRSAR
jgi:hypothetical protein